MVYLSIYRLSIYLIKYVDFYQVLEITHKAPINIHLQGYVRDINSGLLLINIRKLDKLFWKWNTFLCSQDNY
jgi:hypothetical protein